MLSMISHEISHIIRLAEVLEAPGLKNCHKVWRCEKRDFGNSLLRPLRLLLSYLKGRGNFPSEAMVFARAGDKDKVRQSSVMKVSMISPTTRV